MRASITTVELSPRTRAILLGLTLTLALLALAYAGSRGHHAWSLYRNEQAWLNWQAGEMQRAASRYGEVRLPLSGELCKAYAFDNLHGGYVDERRILCEPPSTPRSAVDGFARMQGVASGFRR